MRPLSPGGDISKCHHRDTPAPLRKASRSRAPPLAPLDKSISQQPEDGLLAIFREGGPCLQEANEPRVLHASGGSIGDTLAITAGNRLCWCRQAGVLARCQRECRAFESPHPLSNPCLGVRSLAGDPRRMNPASRRGFSLAGSPSLNDIKQICHAPTRRTSRPLRRTGLPRQEICHRQLMKQRDCPVFIP